MKTFAHTCWILPCTLSLGIAACATPGRGIERSELAERVERAATAEDHAALAEYFEARANAEERIARECRALRERYAQVNKVSDVRDHYEHLMRNHERNAEIYRALAQAHRRRAEPEPGPEDQPLAGD